MEKPKNGSLDAAKVLDGWLMEEGVTGAAVKSTPALRTIRAIVGFVQKESARATPRRAIEIQPEELLTYLDKPGAEQSYLKSAQVRAYMEGQLKAIQQHCRKAGLTWYPWIEVGGGGRGVKLSFTLEWKELPHEAADQADETEPSEPSEQAVEASPSGVGRERALAIADRDALRLQRGEIGSELAERAATEGTHRPFSRQQRSFNVEYEALPPTKTRVGRFFFPKDVMEASSWQWKGYRYSVVIVTLVCWAMAAVVGLILWYSRLSGREYYIFPLTFAGLSVGAWHIFAAPLNKLGLERICKANEWWAGFEHPNQIELIRRGDRTAYVRFCRYTAMCSICGSEVEVDDGGKEFGGRLIGKCIESPREHIFSFDRVTRSGYPLKRPPL